MKLRWALFVRVWTVTVSQFDWCVYLNQRHRPRWPKEAGGYSITRCLRFVVPGLTLIRLCLLNVWMHEYTFYFFSSYLWGLWPPSGLLLDYDGAVCETWSQATWMRWALGASRPREWILNRGNHFWRTLFTSTRVVFVFLLCTTRTFLIRFQGPHPMSSCHYPD